MTLESETRQLTPDEKRQLAEAHETYLDALAAFNRRLDNIGPGLVSTADGWRARIVRQSAQA
jgi:hypothetical protein